MILEKDAFDPDAVFLDDIVDDNVLPRLSLAVDGLTRTDSDAREHMKMPSPETAANEVISASSALPAAHLDSDGLEVYGWESSLWRKLRSYMGF